MSKHYCRGIHDLQPAEPIGPAVDHHAHMPFTHQQGAVAEMAARPDLDLAAGPEKGELDIALLTFLYCNPLLVLLRLCTLRQYHREHAVRELRLDLVGIDAFRNRKAALEGTVTAL